MRLCNKPNDSTKQIPLDGPIHLIYQRGAICFPWADAELYVQVGHYVVIWEAKAQRVSNDGWLVSEEYTSSMNLRQQCQAFQLLLQNRGQVHRLLRDKSNFCSYFFPARETERQLWFKSSPQSKACFYPIMEAK